MPLKKKPTPRPDHDDEELAEYMENLTPQEVERLEATPLPPEVEKLMDESIDAEMAALEVELRKLIGKDAWERKGPGCHKR
jgi:hypothetical protein